MRIYISTIGKFLLASICCAVLSVQAGKISAQVMEVEDGTQVTAIVSDLISPTTPILISPEDEAKLKINAIPFVWKASTDNWLMDHYVLIVNDQVLINDIPLVATSNSTYTLTYDSVTEYYTLTPTATFADGAYQWSITAWDYHENSATSVEWDFTIDTQAPIFTIALIEDQEVEITTSDADSVPSDPIVLEENEPTISGTGESNSTVHLTITYADGSTDEVTFTIAGDGTWSITLDELPRDGTVLLDFLITDPTGNVSILEDVSIVLYTPVVIITIPSVPSITPSEPAKPPIVIEIPILPPSEYLPPVIKKAPQKVMYFVRNATARVREDSVSWLEKLAALLVLVLLLALPAIKLTLLSFWYRYYLSGELLKEFLWLMGWIPKEYPEGIVVTREDMTPVSHALVIISGTTASKEYSTYRCITNEHGIFPRRELVDGEYRISIHHPDYFFPSLSKAPPHLDWSSFYSGAPFKLKKGVTFPPLVIPVEVIEKQQHSRLHKAREAILSTPNVTLPLGFLAGCLCLAFPSVINLTSLLVFAALYVVKKLPKQGLQTEILITDVDKKPVKNVIVGLKKDDYASVIALSQTNEKGEVRLPLDPGLYNVWSVSFKHKLDEGDNKTSSSFKTDKSKHFLPLIMEKAN